MLTWGKEEDLQDIKVLVSKISRCSWSQMIDVK